MYTVILYFTTLYFKTTLNYKTAWFDPKGQFSVLTDLYFKTTCNIRPHFLGPMGGLTIEGPLSCKSGTAFSCQLDGTCNYRYSAPCNLRALHLTMPSILRPATSMIIDTAPILSTHMYKYPSIFDHHQFKTIYISGWTGGLKIQGLPNSINMVTVRYGMTACYNVY